MGQSYDLGLGRGFLDVTPKAQATEGKIFWTTATFYTFVLQTVHQESETVEQKNIFCKSCL